MHAPRTIAALPTRSIALLALLALACASPAREPSSEPSAELAELYRADQAAREGDWSELGPDELHAIVRDDARRLARVRELAAAGELRHPSDRYHAAMVLQHGAEPEDFLLAHVLATAAALGGDERGAWLSAASLDRYLHRSGEPQWFGTQYQRSGDAPWTQEPLASELSDDVRAAFRVPSLEESRARLAQMNAELPPAAPAHAAGVEHAADAAHGAPAHAAAPAPGEASPEVSAAIDRAWDAHLAAARAKDLEGVLALYTDDALYADGAGNAARGRAEIEREERESLARADVGDDVHHVRSALTATGDAAFELGTIEGTLRPKDAEPVRAAWDFTALWRRGPDGAWRIASLAGRAR